MTKTSPILSLPLLLLGACAAAPAASGGSRWTDRLMDPVTAPTLFESPVIATNLRPIAAFHALPDDSIFAGGDVQIVALQARWAVTDRLALIATKDGYVQFNPDAGADESGLADIAAGVKYALVDDPDAGILVTPGITYEIASGDEDVFQGNGDGMLRPFVSAGWDLGPWNLLANVGYDFPLDDDAESTRFTWHAHADWQMTPNFFPLVEINGLTYTDDGAVLPVDFEGLDFFNLGSTMVDGNTLVTGALGARWRVGDSAIGAAWEAPLTSREDLFDWRLTLDWVFWF
jgi:hypothetical protein